MAKPSWCYFRNRRETLYLILQYQCMSNWPYWWEQRIWRERENGRYFYEEWKASTYFAPEAANRSAHSFGSKMQRNDWCFPINVLLIFTIEVRTKLWSKIRIGPIWWIVFRHIIYNDWTWIGPFPIPPHPTNNSNKLFYFPYNSYKMNLPFGRDRWNTEQTPMKKDTDFAFIIPSG
jgi:hypothetical protein